MTQFDLSNPDKVPFAKMPKEAQWAIRGALNDGAYVEFLSAKGEWVKKLSGNLVKPGSVYRIRPEPVTYEAYVWRTSDGNFGMSYLTISPEATKGTATVTTDDGKPVKLVWEAEG